jgi:hypothetical protein
MKRNTVDTAILWLIIIGPIAIGIAVSIYYGGSKVVAIWTGFAGVVLLLLAAALQWQQTVQSAEIKKADGAHPNVSVSDAGIVTKGGDAAPTVFVTIKNSGQGTAYGLTWRAAFAMRAFPDFGILELDRKNIAATFDLPPNGTLFYEWRFTEWGVGNWDLINNGRGAIFAFGEILYKDTEASKAMRCNKYRLYHGGDSLAPEGKFAIAKEGNSTDKNCDYNGPSAN